MTVSGLEVSDLISYLHIDAEDVTDTESALLTAYLGSAKSYACAYTGLTEAKLDEHPETAVAVLCLAGDMYTNKDMYMGGSKASITPNRTVESILNLHAVNLVPTVEEDADVQP